MKKNTYVILGSEGQIGSCFKNFLLSKNENVLSVDLKENLKPLKNEFFLKKDISKSKSIVQIINFADKKFGHIDHVVDCSYPRINTKRSSKLKNYDYNTLKKNVSENIANPIMICELFGEYFKSKKKSGNVILISSIQGVMAPKFKHYEGLKMFSPIEYTAIKFSIVGIVKYFAKFYGKYKINYNCISPGGILKNQSKKFLNKYKNSCQTKGMLNSDDLIGALEFLTNEKSSMVRGQNIIVDDGWTL